MYLTDDVFLHVEMDMDQEGYRQVKSRVQHYVRRREPVLWIAPTDTRIEGIKRHAKSIASHSYYKVVGTDVMRDYEGTEYRVDFLPRQNGS